MLNVKQKKAEQRSEQLHKNQTDVEEAVMSLVGTYRKEQTERSHHTHAPRGKRGQLFSTDILVAMVTIAFVLVLALVAWQGVVDHIEVTGQQRELVRQAHTLAAVLVESPGDPSNWSSFANDDVNTTQVQVLGATYGGSFNTLSMTQKSRSHGLSNASYGSLDPAKLDKLVALNGTHYAEFSRLFGLGAGVQFYLEIQQWYQGSYAVSHTVGKDAPALAKYVVQVERFPLVNGTWGYVKVRLWKVCLKEPCQL